ncbi:S8 family serine peptidase [Coprothermobacter platensis]|uniref:S8 family serine peptidase n=1 Tax=Coprothermobacter platensis TaxID=108819 RepID=UPI00036F92A5|nr:S8 family serine peptidase [Coprothermobacter platensis]
MTKTIKRLTVIFLTLGLLCPIIMPTPLKANTSNKILSTLPPAVLTSTSFQSVLITLKDAPVIEYEHRKGISHLNANTIKADQNATKYETKLLQKQAQTIAEIKQLVPDAKIGYNITWTLNGFTLQIKGIDIKRITDIAEIGSVYLIEEPTYDKLGNYMGHSPIVKAQTLTPTYIEINDDLYKEIHLNDVWQMKDAVGDELTGSGMIVALIDTGVDYTHPDLGGCFGPTCKVIGGYDFGDNDNDPMDQVGHGTEVAGILAADGGIKGVAPKAKILAYKVMPTLTSSTSTAGVLSAVENILPAIDKAAKDGANVINISMVESISTNAAYGQKVIENLDNLGVTLVAAAGNYGSALYCSEPLAPSFCQAGFSAPLMTTFTQPNVITVGASHSDGESTNGIDDYSSMGPSVDFRLKPDLVAPGFVYTTAMEIGYYEPSGTSFAAPIVSSMVALLKQGHPDWSEQDIRAALMNTSTILSNEDNNEPITMLLQGAGRIDALASMKTPLLITPYSISLTATNLKPINLTIRNVSGVNQNITASVQLTLGNFALGANDGLTLSLSASTVYLPKDASATITLTPSADLNKLEKGPHEAIIWVSNGTTQLHVPVLIWNDPSAWWFPVTESRPSKLGDVKALSSTIDFSNPRQRTATIDFTLKAGSMLVDTTTTIPLGYLGNHVYLVKLCILDENNSTIAIAYSKDKLLIGHYEASWNGLDKEGLPVKNGRYKYVLAASDLGFGNMEFLDVNIDTASGYIEVKNSPEITLPTIALNIPNEVTVTKYVFQPDPTFTLVGKTDVGNTIEINGQNVEVDDSGAFTIDIPLLVGDNVVTINAHKTMLGYIKVDNTKYVTINLQPLNLIELVVGKQQFQVNDQTKTLDAPPVIKNSRTLLPIRAVVEAMGGQVQWDAKNKRVDIQYGGTAISLWIGKNTAKVNGKNILIDPANAKVVPEIISSRTMVPLRFVAESLGCTVDWSNSTKTINITYH